MSGWTIVSTTERQARIELTAALRAAGARGWQDGVCQHFSLMLDEHRFLVNPYGHYWSELRASDLVLVDLRDPDGTKGAAHAVALNIHGPIHRRHPRARCVLHAHLHYAAAILALEKGRLEPVYQDGLRFYERIAYDDEYCGLATAAEEGERMARVLGDNRVLMLANHGVVATGPSVAEAFDDLYFLERAAQVQVTAMSCGRPLKRVPQAVARRVREQEAADGDYVAKMHFEALLRRLEREQPEFAD